MTPEILQGRIPDSGRTARCYCSMLSMWPAWVAVTRAPVLTEPPEYAKAYLPYSYLISNTLLPWLIYLPVKEKRNNLVYIRLKLKRFKVGSAGTHQRAMDHKGSVQQAQRRAK